jgi:hypothetical protein
MCGVSFSATFLCEVILAIVDDGRDFVRRFELFFRSLRAVALLVYSDFLLAAILFA